MGFWDGGERVGLCKSLAPISVLLALTTQSHSPELEKAEGASGIALTPVCSHSQLSRAAGISGSLPAALGGKQTESPAPQWDGKFCLLGLALSQFSSYEIPSEALAFCACSSWVSRFLRALPGSSSSKLPVCPTLFPATEHCSKWGLLLLLLPCASC